jgi:hypothetical protein
MIAMLTPALVALLVARVQGRSLTSLGQERIAWGTLGIVGLVVELVMSGSVLGEQPFILTWGSAIWMAALVAMAATLARNAVLRSGTARLMWAAAALGVTLNIAVVAANGGHMPQSQTARIAAGASIERVAGLASTPGWRNIEPMTSETQLWWLGDILPEPAFLPLRNVMSIGDLWVAFGLAGAAFLATGARRLAIDSLSAPALAAS